MQQKVNKDQASGIEFLKIDNRKDKVICFLHGYGASMYDLYSLSESIADAKDYDWIFINGLLPLQGNMLSARAWFPIDMQALEAAMMRGEFREFSSAYPNELDIAINTCLDFLKSQTQNYKELHLGGFSQGAMVSSHLAGRGIDNLKTLTLFSGNLIGKEQLNAHFKLTNRLPFFQSHGKSDQVLSYYQAKDLFELLKLNHLEGEFVTFDGAHEIPIGVLRKWEQFLRRTA
jgi:phospholipase/carboxylesterase